MPDFQLWEIFAGLGIPGLAFGVLYFLFRKFEWKLPAVPKSWTGPLLLVFMVLTSALIFTALVLWAPSHQPQDSAVEPAIQTADERSKPADPQETSDPVSIVLMDTYLKNETYDPSLRQEGVTNSHLIADLIRDDTLLNKTSEIRVVIVGRDFWGSGDVAAAEPDLVILHRSAFNWESDPDRDGFKLKRFLSSMQGTDATFLVYSRRPGTDETYASRLAEDVGLENRIEAHQFSPGNPWTDSSQVLAFVQHIKSIVSEVGEGRDGD